MFKNFIFFFLLIVLLLNPVTVKADKNFRVSAPSYPLTVIAQEQKTASEIIFFCETYFRYLKQVWGIAPKQIKPLNIIIQTPFEKDNSPAIMNAQTYTNFYPDINDPFFKQILCAFIADYLIKANLTLDSNIPDTVPQCISAGISSSFLKDKIDPEFLKTRNTLIEGNIIPLRLFLNDCSSNYRFNDAVFTLQSIYFVNFLISQNFGNLFFIKFLQQYTSSKKQGISFLLKSFHVQTSDEFEKLLLDRMVRKLKIYNIASEQKKYSREAMLLVLDDTLIFQYQDNDSGYISTKAENLKIADMPFINHHQIYQKIIQLNVLTGSSPEKFHPVLKEYIKALNYLMKGAFNEYCNSLYKANFLRDLLKRNKKL